MAIKVVTVPLTVTLTVNDNITPRCNLCATTITKVIVTLANKSHFDISNPATTFIMVLCPISRRFKLTKLLITALLSKVFLVLVNLTHFNHLVRCVPISIALNFASNVKVAVNAVRVGSFLNLRVTRIPRRCLRGINTLFVTLPAVGINSTTVNVIALNVLIF